MRRAPTAEEHEMLRTLIDKIGTDERITEWEAEFLESLLEFTYWSDRQIDVLVDIWAKVMGG